MEYCRGYDAITAPAPRDPAFDIAQSRYRRFMRLVEVLRTYIERHQKEV
jgi:hypothetical protein